jgi:hypothetical protein
MKHTWLILAPPSLCRILLTTIPGAVAQKRGFGVQTNASRKARADTAGAVFGAAQSYPAGFGGASQSVAAAFNGDGILDIAVVNPCSSSNCGSGYASVAVLTGNGDGSFQAPVLYATGSYEPMSLDAGDFNEDGVLDLVVASECAFGCGAGQVGVLLGNGDGTLQAPVSYSTGATSTASLAHWRFQSIRLLNQIKPRPRPPPRSLHRSTRRRPASRSPSRQL